MVYWDRLKPAMEAAGLDVPALAAKLGVSYQAIDKVRRGGALGSQNNIKAARLLGLSPEWLATGKGPRLPAEAAPPAAVAPSLEQALPVVLGALRELPQEMRTEMSARWAALLLAPDSAELARWLGQALGERPWNGVNRRHGSERRQDDAPPPVQETPGRFAA
jgi:hypothetical protein